MKCSTDELQELELGCFAVSAALPMPRIKGQQGKTHIAVGTSMINGSVSDVSFVIYHLKPFIRGH